MLGLVFLVLSSWLLDRHFAVLFLFSCRVCMHGIRRTVSVDLCEFFNGSSQWRCFPVCNHFFCNLPGLHFLLQCMFFWVVVVVYLCQGELFSIINIRRRCRHLDWYCLYVFSDFETDHLRNFYFLFGEKASCCVDWACHVSSFEVKLQHFVICVPQWWSNSFFLEEPLDWFDIYQDDCWFRRLSKKWCKVDKCHAICQELFRVDWIFKLCKGEDFRSEPDRNKRMRFLFWQKFLLWILFCHDKLPDASKTCICHQDKLFS